MLQRLLYFAWNEVFFVLKHELFLLNMGLGGKHFDLELFLTVNAVHMTFPLIPEFVLDCGGEINVHHLSGWRIVPSVF